MKQVKQHPIGIHVGDAILGYYTSSMGRSGYEIECVCGWVDFYYLWSMAGNGGAKCKGCKRLIRYGWGWEIYEEHGKKYKAIK